MNICHVITRLIVGGAQENTILTCRGLVDRGHRVTLVAGPETGPEGSLWEQAAQSKCEIHRLDAMRRAARPIRDLGARRELVRLFKRLRPEIVHTHSSKAGILGRWAARTAGVPIIIHTIHGMSFNRTQPLHMRILFRALERRAAQQTTAFISVADAMTEQAVAAGLAPRSRFVTIRSGLETDRFSPRPDLRRLFRREWGAQETDVVVGTIARLYSNKGYDEIIQAMPQMLNRCPNLRLVWIGDGKHRASYERGLEAIGARDRVTFLGLLSPEEVGRAINGFDILLHASRWEGLPRALVQGLLTEIPAVSFDNDGAPEVVIPNKTGVLVPHGDIAGLAGAVCTLANDPELRHRLGAEGRRRCLAEFDWRCMVEQIEALYVRVNSVASQRMDDFATGPLL